MAHDVFISHAHTDKNSAEEICRRLESFGLKCWAAPRDLEIGEDWGKAIQTAIGSSRVMVLLFSDRANLSPHIVRELANAFYTGRKIIVFRLTNALPRRDMLFYLGGASWYEANNEPTERALEGLAVQIKGLLNGLRNSEELVSIRDASRPMAAASFREDRRGQAGFSTERYPRILKWVGIAVSAAGVGWVCWAALLQRNEDESWSEGNLQSIDHRNRIAPVVENEKVVISSPHYAFTRLGMWVAVDANPATGVRPNSEPTPFPMQDDQRAKVIPAAPGNIVQKADSEGENLAFPDSGPVKTGSSRLARENYVERPRVRLRSKSHHRKAVAESLKSRGIKRWLTSLWRQSIKGIKGTVSR